MGQTSSEAKGKSIPEVLQGCAQLPALSRPDLYTTSNREGLLCQ